MNLCKYALLLFFLCKSPLNKTFFPEFLATYYYNMIYSRADKISFLAQNCPKNRDKQTKLLLNEHFITIGDLIFKISLMLKAIEKNAYSTEKNLLLRRRKLGPRNRKQNSNSECHHCQRLCYKRNICTINNCLYRRIYCTNHHLNKYLLSEF